MAKDIEIKPIGLKPEHEAYFKSLDELAAFRAERKVNIEVTEQQKIYIYTRVYLRDEIEIKSGEKVYIEYVQSGEKLETIFAAYAKKGMEKDKINDFEDILNYQPEDNKKCLCLMIDKGVLDKDDSIPFIRTLFKVSKWYDNQLLKRTDLILYKENDKENMMDYYDIDF
jgi:hypothetical protein